MSTLLTAWQCQVFTATNAEQARKIYAKHEDEIDILLVDYQLSSNSEERSTMSTAMSSAINSASLSHDINGITLIKQLRAISYYSLPAILITATTNEDLMMRAAQDNISYLRKIIKPLALRSLMSSLLTEDLAKNYSHNLT
ncbi:hypothetical protein BPTFM16_02949 [Altererythrobacter insulae]|nr:hypothetical protein BPTFM16_02949 [Altererythrobacter insulae]